MDVHPTKNVSIGIDPYPTEQCSKPWLVDWLGILFYPVFKNGDFFINQAGLE